MPLTPHAKFKTTIIYFIITCGAKIVCAFAVSSVMRNNTQDGTNIKILIEMLPITEHNLLVNENSVIQ